MNYRNLGRSGLKVSPLCPGDKIIRNGLGVGRLFEPVYALQPDNAWFIPVMEPYWKTYPPVYLYYLKNTGKTRRVKTLVDFLINKTQI